VTLPSASLGLKPMPAIKISGPECGKQAPKTADRPFAVMVFGFRRPSAVESAKGLRLLCRLAADFVARLQDVGGRGGGPRSDRKGVSEVRPRSQPFGVATTAIGKVLALDEREHGRAVTFGREGLDSRATATAAASRYPLRSAP
jgi:hypothetical protein